jgi:hypothetical protein
VEVHGAADDVSDGHRKKGVSLADGDLRLLEWREKAGDIV